MRENDATAPPREALVDASAIEHNVRVLREITGTPECIAVVKANGYGHGALTAARAALAGGATRLGVADVREALALREAGITAPVIAWLHAPDVDFTEAVRSGVEIGLSSLEQVRAAADAGARTSRRADVHLKLETGLGRNGAHRSEWHDLFAAAAADEAVGHLRVIGIFSHLSGTSRADDLAQIEAFHDGIALAERHGLDGRLRHIAATAAAIDIPEARLDAVRVGIGIYGVSPLADRTPTDLGLRPAMTVRSRVAAVRRVAAGHGASYGYRYRAPRETTYALVPLGYADGMPRQASNAGPVAIRGERFRVGTIAMDQFVVDVGDLPVEVGDEVLVFGDPSHGAPLAEEWAEAAGTIGYEIVTRIGPRVERTVVGDQRDGPARERRA